MRLVGTAAAAFMDAPGAAIRGADWGGLRCVHVALGPGTALGPVLKGLPDDRMRGADKARLKGIPPAGRQDITEEIGGEGALGLRA